MLSEDEIKTAMNKSFAPLDTFAIPLECAECTDSRLWYRKSHLLRHMLTIHKIEEETARAIMRIQFENSCKENNEDEMQENRERDAEHGNEVRLEEDELVNTVATGIAGISKLSATSSNGKTHGSQRKHISADLETNQETLVQDTSMDDQTVEDLPPSKRKNMISAKQR